MVANGGTIAALSVAGAAYVGQIVPLVSQDHIIFAVAKITFTRAHLFGLVLIAILTCVNVFGLRWGALLQNVSTWTKFTAMAAFVFLGFAIGKGNWSNFHPHEATRRKSKLLDYIQQRACGANVDVSDFQSRIMQICRQIAPFPIEYRFDLGSRMRNTPSHLCSILRSWTVLPSGL